MPKKLPSTPRELAETVYAQLLAYSKHHGINYLLAAAEFQAVLGYLITELQGVPLPRKLPTR